jgi:molybdopterin-guanine dinucleotide biosynthesis protein A
MITPPGRADHAVVDEAALGVVVVLAGGGSTRLGEDKTRVHVGGVPVLDRLLGGLTEVARDVPVVVVGPARPVTVAPTAPLTWCREEPPGGGPVAGLACGLHQAVAQHGLADDDLVGVLAGDLPFAAPSLGPLVDALRSAPPGTSTALGVDETGDDQLLVGVHRVGPLRAAVEAQGAAGAVRRVVGRLVVVRVPLPSPVTLDVDTAEDLAHARRLVDDEQSDGRAV